jgi:serine/threonine-protein kinase RsbW
MTNSMSSTDVANAERFERIGVEADAESASRTREEFACWLERFLELDPIRTSDLVLAVNEALANAVEFAYLTLDFLGTVDVRAHYDAGGGGLIVTVSDHGVWRVPDPTSTDRSRGRGIPLMRALSDRTNIETSSRGTRVHLEWDGITSRR